MVTLRKQIRRKTETYVHYLVNPNEYYINGLIICYLCKLHQ